MTSTFARIIITMATKGHRLIKHKYESPCTEELYGPFLVSNITYHHLI